MPPMPPALAAAAAAASAAGSGLSATMDSVVRTQAPMDAAFSSAVRVNLLYPKLQGLQMTLTEEKYLTAYTKMRDSAQNHHIDYPDPYCLAQISNFNKLIALSNKQSIPIFEVVLDPQMVQEGQSRTLAWFKFLYEALAVRVLELTSDE